MIPTPYSEVCRRKYSDYQPVPTSDKLQEQVEQHIFDLWCSHNPKYENTQANVLANDAMPFVGTAFSLVQLRESCPIIRNIVDLGCERSMFTSNPQGSTFHDAIIIY